jgi:hypothetical protein
MLTVDTRTGCGIYPVMAMRTLQFGALSDLFKVELAKANQRALWGGFLALGSKQATLSMINIVCLHLGQFG